MTHKTVWQSSRMKDIPFHAALLSRLPSYKEFNGQKLKLFIEKNGIECELHRIAENYK